MMLGIALVGTALLVGLAVLIGRIERVSTETAFLQVAAGRRENGEERRRLMDRELDLENWERELHEQQERLGRLEQRLRKLEQRPARPPSGDTTCDLEDDDGAAP
ncbi:hypothetical protein [Pseudonocardia endophytica]|uniref:Uncharacterized protein n=1 Tax=Pseudonocardia endophytica TaxID=401976 RepID=A0A4R1I0V0_PSEEN|nr:hypothetical protein [Pseudonocardia endophytica]TCK27155.1 hypothetical protein EV378_3014 [Pseudonocardia endophytica]